MTCASAHQQWLLHVEVQWRLLVRGATVKVPGRVSQRLCLTLTSTSLESTESSAKLPAISSLRCICRSGISSELCFRLSEGQRRFVPLCEDAADGHDHPCYHHSSAVRGCPGRCVCVCVCVHLSAGTLPLKLGHRDRLNAIDV